MPISVRVRAAHRNFQPNPPSVCRQCLALTPYSQLFSNRKFSGVCKGCTETNRRASVSAARKLAVSRVVQPATKMCTGCNIEKPRVAYRKAQGTKVAGCVVPKCKECEAAARKSAWGTLSEDERRVTNLKTVEWRRQKTADARARRAADRATARTSKLIRTEKVCNTCETLQTLDNFSPNSKSLDGHIGRCKACEAEYASRRRAADPKGYLEQAKSRRHRKPGAVSARNERVRDAKRKMPWADPQQIRQVYALARSLTKSTGVTHAVDHIYPLVSEYVCGLHVLANLRAIPKRLNSKKLNKLPGHLRDELWEPDAQHVFKEITHE